MLSLVIVWWVGKLTYIFARKIFQFGNLLPIRFWYFKCYYFSLFLRENFVEFLYSYYHFVAFCLFLFNFSAFVACFEYFSIEICWNCTYVVVFDFVLVLVLLLWFSIWTLWRFKNTFDFLIFFQLVFFFVAVKTVYRRWKIMTFEFYYYLLFFFD